MTLADITTEDLKCAAMRALEALEGNNLYTSGPWPIDVRPLADPMTVIYYAADGNSYERTMVPDMQGDTLNVVLGDRREVEARTLWVPVQSDVAPAFKFSAGKSTTWSGLIFRAGDYPDKGCSFAEDDLETFVKNFPEGGVPVMSEHEDSLIGQAMKRHGARLTRIWRKAGELYGEIVSPSWLDEALDGMVKSVSVGLNFATKTLDEISLVLNPRVADAAVFHKAAVAFSKSPDFQDFAQSHPSEAASIANEARKAPSPASHMENPTIKQRVQAFFAKLAPDQRDGLTEEELNAVFATSTTAPAGDPALLQRIEQLENEQKSFKAQSVETEDTNAGLGFYADLLQKGKATPAEKEFVLTTFASARAADRANQATFSANADGSFEQKVRKQFEDRPAQFRMGPSTLQGQHVPTVESPYGIFSADLKEETK